MQNVFGLNLFNTWHRPNFLCLSSYSNKTKSHSSNLKLLIWAPSFNFRLVNFKVASIVLELVHILPLFVLQILQLPCSLLLESTKKQDPEIKAPSNGGISSLINWSSNHKQTQHDKWQTLLIYSKRFFWPSKRSLGDSKMCFKND